MKLLLCLLPLLAFAQDPKPPVKTYPAVLKEVPAAYSDAAKAAGLQGSVILYVQVKADGKPGTVSVVHPLGLGLDEKAVEAIRSREYTPAKVNGEAVDSAISEEVQFTLQGNEAGWKLRRSLTAVQHDGKRVNSMEQPRLAEYVAPVPAVCEGKMLHAAFTISPGGIPEEVKAVNPARGTVPPAVAQAILGWKFVPGKLNGVPARSTAKVQFACGTAPEVAMEANVQAGAPTTPPAVRFKVDPEYSEEARQAKAQGTALLSVVVGRSGRAKSMRVVRSLGMGLDEKAMAAVSQWLFAPGTKSGAPVDVQATIEINFRLL